MARSFYEARNRFVLNSKMDEKDFKVWLTLYLQGIPVSEAIAKFPKMARADAPIPSAKTVTTLFRRIGRYIFHKGFEPYLWSNNRDVQNHYLGKGRSAYQEHLDDVARNVIQYAKDTISLEQFHAMAGTEHVGGLTDRIALEIRALLVARKGVSDLRADVGLAFLRAFTPGSLPRNRMHAEHLLEMAENVLQHMLNDPMDEEGNTDSYFRYDSSKPNENNNGVFERKYWATHGISIAEWKKRRKHKEEKRRLGYIRTAAGEPNLQEQRESLQAVGCIQIFEDVDVAQENESLPGLDALLAEAFEYDTIVVLSMDRFGPYDERWCETMETLQRRGVELCAINDDIDTSGRILKGPDTTLTKL